MIFFRKKLSRLVDVKAAEKRMKEEPLDLEKGDMPAILLAAFAVFTPVLLGLIAVAWILFRLFAG